MTVMRCPHCGAENFTMEGWEDLDHCSSCGKPLGEPEPDASEGRPRSRRASARTRGAGGGEDCNAKRPRPA